MKRGNALVSILVVSIIALLFIELSMLKSNITGNVISVDLPRTCENSSIQTIWESIFNEPFSSMTIKTNSNIASGYCQEFEAIKYTNQAGYDKLFYLTGRLNNETNLSYLNFEYDEISDTGNNFTLNATEYRISLDLKTYLFTNKGAVIKDRTSSISNTAGAIQESNIYFKKNVSDSSLWSDVSSRFEFLDYSSTLVRDTISISKNKVEDYGWYNRQVTVQSCTPNWTSYNTTCRSDDTKTRYFSDSNSCGTTRANETLNCDYNGNGIIGNYTNLNSSFNSDILIEDREINSSINYTGIKKVSILEDDIEIITFDWDFSLPLDLKKAYFETGSSGSKGYILIRGLDTEKRVLVEQLNSSSNSVCIKNSEVISISAMSSSCSRDDEIIVECPGSDMDYTCDITDDYFDIQGVTHSAVREYYLSSSNVCTPLWNCTEWFACTGGIQERVCLDMRGCNSDSGKPDETQACSSCTPRWTCTSWSECDLGFQTRTCTDRNNCNSDSAKPEESKECTSTGENQTNYLLPTLIIIISAVIILVVILIIHYSHAPKGPSVRFITQEPSY